MSDFTKSHITKHDSHGTPPDLYAQLDAEFQFDDDPCPLDPSPLHDGLLREWGMSTFVNPPYSNPGPWCRKAYKESLKGKTVVGLLRGDTSTAWFHDWVWHKAELRFIRGRLKFYDLKKSEYGGPAPFASIIAIWKIKP